MSDKVIVVIAIIVSHFIANVCYYGTIGGLHTTTWGRRETYLENCSQSARLYIVITVTKTSYTVWI